MDKLQGCWSRLSPLNYELFLSFEFSFLNFKSVLAKLLDDLWRWSGESVLFLPCVWTHLHLFCLPPPPAMLCSTAVAAISASSVMDRGVFYILFLFNTVNFLFLSFLFNISHLFSKWISEVTLLKRNLGVLSRDGPVSLLHTGSGFGIFGDIRFSSFFSSSVKGVEYEVMSHV